MARYINKDILAEEIKKRLKHNSTRAELDRSASMAGKEKEDEDILTLLDTLEIKEENLEKEFDNYTKDILACDVQFEPFTHLYNCAKYFYELGLKAQKGESE